MLYRKISRKKFLRLMGATVAGVVVTNFGINAQEESTSVINLNGGNADVWAWERTISGQVTDTACEVVTLNVNQHSIEATVENGQFSATIPIAEGENQITASCEHDGQIVESEPVIYT